MQKDKNSDFSECPEVPEINQRPIKSLNLRRVWFSVKLAAGSEDDLEA